MKKFTKIMKGTLAIMLIAGSLSLPAYASESISPSKSIAAVTEIPAGFTFLDTFTRSPKNVFIGTIIAKPGASLELYMPNNSKKDIIQGTVTFIPLNAGSTKVEFDFINFYQQNKTIDSSSLIRGVTYMIGVKAYSIGTSDQGKMYYKINN